MVRRLRRPVMTLFSPDAPSFPSGSDAPALRAMLGDSDAGIRALAIEALAVLGRPEDIPKIAALLDDRSKGAPSLEYNYPASAMYIDPRTTRPGARDDPDSPLIRRSWRTKTVGQYARRAIRYMTGRDLDSREFAAWWKVNRNCRHCLWYWQQRIDHELRAVDYARRSPRSFDRRAAHRRSRPQGASGDSQAGDHAHHRTGAKEAARGGGGEGQAAGAGHHRLARVRIRPAHAVDIPGPAAPARRDGGTAGCA